MLVGKRIMKKIALAGLAGRVGFKAYTVYGNDRQAVGYGVAALYGYPCTQLAHFFFLVPVGHLDGGHIR